MSRGTETDFRKMQTENHSITTPNLPNRAYQIKQIFVGVHALHGVDKQGHIVDSFGADLSTLEEDFFEAAQKIDRDHFLP